MVIDLTSLPDQPSKVWNPTEVICISDSDDEVPSASPLKASRVATCAGASFRPAPARKKLTSSDLSAKRKLRLAEKAEAKKAHVRKKARNKRAEASSSSSNPPPSSIPATRRKRIPNRPLLLPPSGSTSMLPTTPGVEIRDRPPTPPPCDPRNPKLGPGMRKYSIDLIYANDMTLEFTLPFAVSEIPSFNRSTWTGLNTHRYKFESLLHYPRTPEAQAKCVESLKGQLLSLLRLKEWAEGEEPVITFPRVEGVLHEFVDIRFRTKEQHEKGRNPRPPLRAGCDPLIPWLHAAFVDKDEHFTVQFSHPDPTPEPMIKEGEEEWPDEIGMFGVHFIYSLKGTPFASLGKPILAYMLPRGFPHSPNLIPTAGAPVVKPEYIVIIKKNKEQRAKGAIAIRESETLTPYVEVTEHDEQYWIELGKTWVKVWWEGRPDLCDYCKDSWDGHLNHPPCSRKERAALKKRAAEAAEAAAAARNGKKSLSG